MNKQERNPIHYIRSLLQFDTQGRCTNAFEILTNPTVLKMGYETTKSKAGQMVKGTDKITLDGISNT